MRVVRHLSVFVGHEAAPASYAKVFGPVKEERFVGHSLRLFVPIPGCERQPGRARRLSIRCRTRFRTLN